MINFHSWFRLFTCIRRKYFLKVLNSDSFLLHLIYLILKLFLNSQWLDMHKEIVLSFNNNEKVTHIDILVSLGPHESPCLPTFHSNLSSLYQNFWDEVLSIILFTFWLTSSYFVIITTFRMLCPLAFFRCLAIRVTFREFRTELLFNLLG